MSKTTASETGPTAAGEDADPATIEDLFADLITLREEADDEETHEEILDIKHLLVEAHDRGLIESGVRDLDGRDAAEAFVGSVIFASPLLVEGGIFDIGAYLFEFTVAGVPIFLILNTVFVVVMTYALMEWTGQDRSEARALFGTVPVRLVMTLVISFLVAAVLMTVWGRVNGWRSPVEALARINVIWTVGSLGAALGDILAEDEGPPEVALESAMLRADARLSERDDLTAVETPAEVKRMSDGALIDALHREFDDLEAVVDESDNREEVNRLRDETVEATLDDVFGDKIQKYTSRDIAEAFVGSIFFAIPFLVEDGVFEIAEFFLSFRIGVFPVYFLINTAFVLLMILALVYWAGPQEVQVNRPIFGFIPRRMVGIAVVSFLTSAALMTMWGRVNNWADPVVALARISVVWTVASFGASLGDILPGESSGSDINDELREIGD
ncbi:DUF2391 family protein [Halovenus sp. WSH3]|uniref:DUF2391 family protein n=1 Tax=Halovenus carboxidivorans TaxID=2692199 RepID=A0A6B0SY44_9EURY|nr:DUF2391 family protein [Halovenus carboxidivorans]MXR50265.1 DUF2391 family protein [Halovenus carboxidivorans]